MRLAAIALVAALAPAAPAAAQSAISIGISTQEVAGGNGRDIPVTASGVVSVDFHGDRAAGCEQAGLCDVSGTDTWDPGRSGALTVFGNKQPEGGLLFFDVGAGQSSRTAARVRRTAPDGSVHTCSDVAADRGGGELQASGGQLVVDLGALLGTRCAGPVDADVAGLVPTARVSAQQLAAGRTSIDLTGERSFASHGLAGTLRSSVVLTLGAPGRPQQDGSPSRRGRKFRLATAEYAIESVTGHVGLAFGGLPAPELCAALDACDLSGTIDTSLAATGGRATLVAFGPGRLSRRQLLRKLGVARGGRTARRQAEGAGQWSGGGTLAAALSRAGAPACRDEASLPGGALQLAERGPRLTVSYLTGLDPTGGGLPLRCGGPSDSDIGATNAPASGSVPSSILRRRRFAVHLGRGGSFAGEGYQGSSSADLTVVLRRRRVSIRSFRVPIPSGSGSFPIVDELVRSRHGRAVAR